MNSIYPSLIEIYERSDIEDAKKMIVILMQSKNLIHESTPIHQAVFNGDIDTVQFIVSLIKISDNDLISLAASKGYFDIVKYLISEGK